MKTTQPDLFSDSAPAPAPAPAPASTPTRTDISLGAHQAARLSPAQQRFNKLLEKIGRLKRQIAEIQALTDVYRPLYEKTLAPLHKQYGEVMRRMALWLDGRLDRKGLSPTQQRAAIEIFCGLCETLAADGDADMAALHDKRSPRSLRQKAEEDAAEMRALMEGVLGKPLEVESHDESMDPLDAVMRASHETLQHAMQAEQDKREAARAKKVKKPTAAQRKAEQKQEDAETVLRKVFRQLASALHPDRERDPTERLRKTALMSEANAAYGRQDLVELLHLQLRIAQVDTQDLLLQPEDRIASMSLLLKQQAAELENELFARHDQLVQEFALDVRQMPSDAQLQVGLDRQQDALKDELALMEADLQSVQEDAGFKRWLKLQIRLSKI